MFEHFFPDAPLKDLETVVSVDCQLQELADSNDPISPFSRDFTECPSCKSSYSLSAGKPTLVPKLLPCLHTICDSCIHGQSNSSSRKCPICRFSYPPADHPDNALALNLIEALALKEESFSPPCDECDEGNPATHRCLTCALYLCAVCQAQHARAKATKDHPTQTLAEARSCAASAVAGPGDAAGGGGILELVRRPAEPCRAPGHDGQRLTMYCWPCARLVCMQCVALEHPRPGHDCLPADEAFSAQSRSWQTALDELQAERARLAAERQGEATMMARIEAALAGVA